MSATHNRANLLSVTAEQRNVVLAAPPQKAKGISAAEFSAAFKVAVEVADDDDASKRAKVCGFLRFVLFSMDNQVRDELLDEFVDPLFSAKTNDDEELAIFAPSKSVAEFPKLEVDANRKRIGFWSEIDGVFFAGSFQCGEEKGQCGLGCHGAIGRVQFRRNGSESGDQLSVRVGCLSKGGDRAFGEKRM